MERTATGSQDLTESGGWSVGAQMEGMGPLHGLLPMDHGQMQTASSVELARQRKGASHISICTPYSVPEPPPSVLRASAGRVMRCLLACVHACMRALCAPTAELALEVAGLGRPKDKGGRPPKRARPDEEAAARAARCSRAGSPRQWCRPRVP
jgi:hypothetical protein